MPSPSSLFHAFLRPCVLQILRATGYHGTSPVVLDALTDLAARYMSLLCEKTASNAVHRHGDAGDYALADVRLALEEVGALLPQRVAAEQECRGEEDLRGVEEFARWFSGPRMKEITEFARGDGDEVDYLNELKRRHNKTADDAKFQGTILGKPNDTGELDLEIEGGGEIKTIEDWICQRSSGLRPTPAPPPEVNGDGGGDGGDGYSTPASSGLSSVGDRLEDEGLEAMDMS